MLGFNNVTGTCLQILSVAIHHSTTGEYYLKPKIGTISKGNKM